MKGDQASFSAYRRFQSLEVLGAFWAEGARLSTTTKKESSNLRLPDPRTAAGRHTLSHSLSFFLLAPSNTIEKEKKI